MLRPDLVALTDDGLVQLSNAGLVKRGLRELAEGVGPQVEELADGAIEAHFLDGTVTRLAAGKAPEDASCTCPASGMCRHRISLVLSYRHAQTEGTQAAEPKLWDPGTLDSAALEAALPNPIKAELARLRAAPITVRLSYGLPPTAALPMATVRFLSPDEAAFARCDCVAEKGCAHIVLAVEAFRAAAGAEETTLGAAQALKPAEELREMCDAVLQRLLEDGATAGLAAHGALIDRARAGAEEQGATWLVLALEALAAQIGAYDQRSAVYDEAEVLALATELYARPRATTSSALGIGEALETTMAKTRLASLGARLQARGAEVLASVALFDTDTGAPLLMEKVLAPAGKEARVPHEAAIARLMAPGVSVKGLARGQMLTSVAHRRADGTVRLGSGARGKSTLVGRSAILDVRPPLLAASVDALRGDFATRPPSFLMARNRVQNMRVFNVEGILGQVFEPGAQVWRAAVTLADGGGTLSLQRAYDAAAPAALDVLGAAFATESGGIRQIAGQVWLESGAVVCDPWSIAGETLIVPDCDGAIASAAAPLSLPAQPPQGPAAALAFLAGAAHAGARRRDEGFHSRGRRLVEALQASGFAMAAERVDQWLGRGDVDDFGRAAVWLSVLLQQDNAGAPGPGP